MNAETKKAMQLALFALRDLQECYPEAIQMHHQEAIWELQFALGYRERPEKLKIFEERA